MVRLKVLVELQLTTATVHLWLEEYVTGDEIEAQNIPAGLDHASFLLSTILAGGSVDRTGSRLPSLDDLELVAGVKRIAGHLETFADLTMMRFRGFGTGQDVGIGSTLDVGYDLAFKALQAEAGALESSIRDRLVDNTRLAQMAGCHRRRGGSLVVA